MPMFDYVCENCGTKDRDALVHDANEVYRCRLCWSPMKKLPSAVSFKMKGLRAANGYGSAFIDTPGTSRDGQETGFSFSSNRGGTIDHNLGNR